MSHLGDGDPCCAVYRTCAGIAPIRFDCAALLPRVQLSSSPLLTVFQKIDKNF